jgi:hypothetical protein
VEAGCIKPLCDLLTVHDVRIVTVALEGLENILKVRACWAVLHVLRTPRGARQRQHQAGHAVPLALTWCVCARAAGWRAGEAHAGRHWQQPLLAAGRERRGLGQD